MLPAETTEVSEGLSNPFPVKDEVEGEAVLLTYGLLIYGDMHYIKAVPLQACSGPEGSRKLRFPDFMTTAQDGGKVVSLTHRPHLSLGNVPGTHFC
jgi:hypothetical protein